jgi:hypothetical protein
MLETMLLFLGLLLVFVPITRLVGIVATVDFDRDTLLFFPVARSGVLLLYSKQIVSRDDVTGEYDRNALFIEKRNRYGK